MSPQARRPRVVIVERYALVAETFEIAIRATCEAIPVVTGHSGSTAAVVVEVLRSRPDVALVDMDLGPVDCERLVEELAKAGVVVLVLTNHAGDEARSGECLRRGARGALDKQLGLRPVLQALQRAIARQPVIDPADARRLLVAARDEKTRDGQTRERLALLTAREGEVLRDLMRGASCSEIARERFVAEATVRTQVRSILGKLEVNSQLAAVAVAHYAGWRAAAPRVA
jgi:two-component system, NarL family, nitrate/nitrite response regulator NarL